MTSTLRAVFSRLHLLRLHRRIRRIRPEAGTRYLVHRQATALPPAGPGLPKKSPREPVARPQMGNRIASASRSKSGKPHTATWVTPADGRAPRYSAMRASSVPAGDFDTP